MKIRKTIFTTALFTLVCFGLCQQVQSATDTPDPGGSLPTSNTADGQGALGSLTTGLYNSAFGFLSLLSNADANFNTGVGAGALLVNNASNNTAVGAGGLFSNTDGGSHTAVGTFALFSQDGGTGNTAVGAFALEVNASSGNAAVGFHALDSFTGGLSTAIGADTMVNATTGSENVALGFAAGNGITTGSNIIAIGANVTGVSTTNGELDDSCYIGNIKDAGVDAGTSAVVFVDQNGKLGTTALPNTGALPNAQALLGKVQELQVLVARQQNQIEALTAGLQKVSAQLEVSKPAPQVVANKQ
jgi:hypothetical protein